MLVFRGRACPKYFCPKFPKKRSKVFCPKFFLLKRFRPKVFDVNVDTSAIKQEIFQYYCLDTCKLNAAC